MSESLPTKERLARAMEQAMCPVPLIAAARAGRYDDYESDLAMPLVELVGELRALGQHALAERVVAGEFDGTKEESDAWAASPEGRAAFWELLPFGAAEPLLHKPKRAEATVSEPLPQRIGVESIFGANTREPAVQVVIPRAARAPVMRAGPSGPVEDRDVFGLQMAPDEARALALNLLEAAEASLGDGFVMHFFMQEMDLTLEQAAPILIKFRGYRTRLDPAGT